METLNVAVVVVLLATEAINAQQGSCEDEAGNVYQNGTSFSPDGCNTCRCINGVLGCTLMACVTLPTPGICVHNGIVYKVGQTYKDDCNTCTCMANGEGACTRMACLPKVCESNGKRYGAGEQFLDADNCSRCSCHENGAVKCTRKVCR